MIWAVDFDGTIVREDHPYDDVTSPLEFLPGAREGLYALRAAGHTLVLWSGRASRALLYDAQLCPLVRAGLRPAVYYEAGRPMHQARYTQMLAFIARELPGVFGAIDDGAGGKLMADVFFGNQVVRYAEGGSLGGQTWEDVIRLWGQPPPEGWLPRTFP